jgi:hypothetical protein
MSTQGISVNRFIGTAQLAGMLGQFDFVFSRGEFDFAKVLKHRIIASSSPRDKTHHFLKKPRVGDFAVNRTTIPMSFSRFVDFRSRNSLLPSLQIPGAIDDRKLPDRVLS